MKENQVAEKGLDKGLDLGSKINTEMIKWITENQTELILGGVATIFTLLIVVAFIMFIFSKIKKPVAIKVPLIISLLTGLLFSGGVLTSVILPIYMRTKIWTEFFTAGLILSYFFFIAAMMLIANYFGKKALGKYSENLSEKGIILGIRNMPDGSTAINPKWFFMNWKSLFTNALCLGAIGSGKTSAVLIKIVQQILMMKKTKPAAFILDIKGDLYETVRTWNHPRGKDLVCYGYGYEPVNILGNENILKTVNNLSKGFSYLDETASRVSYYQDKQKDYLKFMIRLLRLFCNRPAKLKSNAYIYNRYIKYRSEHSESIWTVFTIGTDKGPKDLSKHPPLKEQTITTNTEDYLAEFDKVEALVTSDDFTVSDIFELVKDIHISKAFFKFVEEYIKVLNTEEFKEFYNSYQDLAELSNALNDYRTFVFDRDFEKNISGLKNPLSTLSDSSISKYFNARGKAVDFAKEIEDGKIIFVNVPEGDLGSEVARLIGIQFLFQYISTLNRRNSVLSAVSKDKPVFILIDEFFKFINKEIMNFTSTSRSARAVNILLGQSLGQFPEEYKEALKSNLRTKLVFSIGDEVTAEQMSRYLGEHITSRRSKSKSYGVNKSTAQSESEQFDRKIKPHDLIELKPFHAAASHYDGSRTLPAEIIDLPAWFKDEFNIFPVEHFIFIFSAKVKKEQKAAFLKAVEPKLSSLNVKMHDFTVHKNALFFTLSFRFNINEKAVDFVLNNVSKIGEYKLNRFSCSYDELLDKKRNLQIPEPNVNIGGK